MMFEVVFTNGSHTVVTWPSWVEFGIWAASQIGIEKVEVLSI